AVRVPAEAEQPLWLNPFDNHLERHAFVTRVGHLGLHWLARLERHARHVYLEPGPELRRIADSPPYARTPCPQHDLLLVAISDCRIHMQPPDCLLSHRGPHMQQFSCIIS